MSIQQKRDAVYDAAIGKIRQIAEDTTIGKELKLYRIREELNSLDRLLAGLSLKQETPGRAGT